MTDLPDAPQLRSVHKQIPFAMARVVIALVVREMATSYGRKPGGYLWSIVEPVAGIAMLCWVFVSLGARHPGLGTNFPIFYATGLLPFTVYTTMASRMMSALTFSRALLAYPRVTIVDVLLSRLILTVITEMLVLYLVLGGILLIWDTGTEFRVQEVMLGFAMAAALGAGMGTLNCYLSMQFALWSSFWNVLTRPLFLLSGIFMVVDQLPVTWQSWLALNPLVHVIWVVRMGFYHGYEPAMASPAYVFGIALVTGVVGLLFLWRTHRDLLDR